MYIYMYSSMYIYIYIYIFTYISIHIYICIYTCVHTVCVCERERGCLESHELKWRSLVTNFDETPLAAASVGQVLYTYSHVYIYIHIHICLCKRICIYIYIYIYTYIHIYIYTYICVHIVCVCVRGGVFRIPRTRMEKSCHALWLDTPCCRPIYPQKSPIYAQKSPVYTEKSPMYPSTYAHTWPTVAAARSMTTHLVLPPCIPSKEPYILSKEPYIHSKEPYMPLHIRTHLTTGVIRPFVLLLASDRCVCERGYYQIPRTQVEESCHAVWWRTFCCCHRRPGVCVCGRVCRVLLIVYRALLSIYKALLRVYRALWVYIGLFWAHIRLFWVYIELFRVCVW